MGQLLDKTHNRKGSLIFTCIIAMAIVSLLGFSLFSLTFKNSNLSYRNELSVKAFHLAQAGLSVASAILAEDFSKKDDSSLFPKTSLSDGNYDVTILEPNGQVVIQSVGEVHGVKRTIYVGIKSNDSVSPFGYALFSNNKGTINGNPIINGSIHTNVDWTIEGNPIINGTASAMGNIQIDGDPVIDQIVEGTSYVNFPTYDFNEYFNLAAPEDRYSGDQSWENDMHLQPSNGVIYINGDLTIYGNLYLTGGIVTTGKITIYGNVNQSEFPDMPAFMSRDDEILVLGNIESSDGLIYSATSDIRILGNVWGEGHIIAFDEILLAGNIEFSYPSDITNTNSEGGFTKLWYAEK